MASKNLPPQNLRAQFRPFYDKALARDPLFAQSVADKIANDRPEVKAARDAAAKHKAEADALIKYIIRKDKPSTKARAKGLAERIAQLRKDYADYRADKKSVQKRIKKVSRNFLSIEKPLENKPSKDES